ncbi:hypothetical protein RUM43_013276 [Polyplax serrata]|uniref:Cysteine sulfinic acid decarboxylase n=1 Tax=Polyplax serrata TaxID=468196 RepID=A0AAN8PRG0_POLSC
MLTVISEQKQSVGFIQSPFDETFCGKNIGGRTEKQVEQQNNVADDVKQEFGENLQNLPLENVHSRFITKCVGLILKKAVFEGTSRGSKVLEWHDPEHMKNLFDFKLHVNGESETKLVEYVSNIIKCSVKTGHPYFVNQLFSGVDPYGLIGQWLTDALNPSVYTYEVSPVFSIMEDVVLEEMRRIVGFPEGKGDGTFCPGGSISNGFGISCARHMLFPEIKKTGVHAVGRLVLYTSRDAHYSIVKLATFMGLGSENVIAIETDTKGKMKVEELENAIIRTLKTGGKPFMVSATAGTTVLGAFDPLESIGDVCKKYKLWLHVDAAWGGGCLMSEKHKKKADSVTWNPHKLLGVPQQCSVFLTRHQNLLQEVHSAQATYLFQKDKFYDVKYDTGDKHIQCGRRADVLKFWFMWKAKGSSGFESHIDKIFDTARYFKESIEQKSDFQLVLTEPECTNVCFWYIPRSLQSSNYTEEELHKVAPRIKERMMREGSMMVTYQPLRELPNFFRLVIGNSALGPDDMDHIIEVIQTLGSDI